MTRKTLTKFISDGFRFTKGELRPAAKELAKKIWAMPSKDYDDVLCAVIDYYNQNGHPTKIGSKYVKRLVDDALAEYYQSN